MRIVALFSVILIAYPSLRVGAQAPQSPLTGGLTITVLKGSGGRNSIKSRTGTPIEVEVRDSQGNPVAGAQTIFQLPSFGPSGSFPGGELSERTTTGPSGQATMNGFVPNAIEGTFTIRITADSGSLAGSASVSEVNVAELAADKQKSHKGLWILVAAGAGGGIAAAVFGSGKGSTAAPISPSVTVNPGAISVGGPR